MSLSRFTPRSILAAAIGVCLLIFLATLAVPRVDGQLIGSDGTFYFLYLPSVWLDGDFDFTNQIEIVFASRSARMAELLDSSNLTARGIPSNQWPIGPMILWSPAYLLAHVVAHGADALGFAVDTSGHGQLYQAFVLISSILYGGVGLWYCYRLAAELTGEWVAMAATLLVLFAGNIVYYMTIEPYMAHNTSLFVSGLFFWTWYRQRNRHDMRSAAILGALGGLLALIRPQAGLFVTLPFLMQLPTVWRTKQVTRYLRNGIVAALVALLVFTPQLYVWGQVYGSYFTSPYAQTGLDEAFAWFRPKLWQTLFSSYRGLFIWHPIFLLACFGARYTIAKARPWLLAGVIGFVMQWYIISAWGAWYQGDAFGGRMFIVCTPFFVLALAQLIQHIVSHLFSWRWVGWLSLVLITLNGLLLLQYRLTFVMPHRIPSYAELLFGRFPLIWRLFNQLVNAIL